ncbi:MAG: hypothetical protein V4671_20200 [Armatimonadota bacterium]
MPYKKTDRERLEAGLCVTCGAVRGAEGTATRCPSCAQKYRETAKRWREQNPNRIVPKRNPETRRRRHARYYRKRVAAGRCVTCSKIHLPANEIEQGNVSCAACRLRNREYMLRSLQKRRDRKAGIPEGHPYHWPRGENPVPLPGGPGRFVGCGLNRDADIALKNLWDRYKKAEIAAGRQPRHNRVSRLVREAIHQWKDRRIGPSPYPHTLIVRNITVYLDQESYRILDRQARADFKGNLSAALRLILIATGYPRPVPVIIPRHRDKWYEGHD